MKEKISIRSKKQYGFLLAISIFTGYTSTLYIKVPLFSFVAIPMLVLASVATVAWTVMLVDPSGVIEREEDTLTIRRGFSKTKVKISDVKSIDRLPHLTKEGEYQENGISIKITENGEEKTLSCGDVLNVNATILRIRVLIAEYQQAKGE